MGVRVVTDSACDLPEAIAEELDIRIVPLTIRFGEEEYVDREELSASDFYKKMSSTAAFPETAAPSPGAFEAAFRAAAEDGADGVLCVNLSSDLSATLQSAQNAARAIGDDIPVRVVDSKSITMGLGMMCIQAARAARDGASLDDLAAMVEELVPRTRVYGALDTLENLKKGGRIGGAQALMGSLLSIKPIIDISTGKVEQESKQRTRAKALRYLAQKVAEHGHVENLAALHGGASDFDELLDLLAEHYPRDEILTGEIGATIGTHGGLGVVGVTFQVAR
jgi:DegV family protein with EDD domain